MARIRGFGKYLPARIVNNQEIGPLVGVEPDWIEQQTGIVERRWASEDEAVTTLAVNAARDCLTRCAIDSSEIGLVLVASGTPERRFPGPAAQIAAALDLAGRPAIDLPIASAGSLFGVALAASLADTYGNVLVIGAEIMSRAISLHPAHRDTAILFGDGAGACIVSPNRGSLEIRDSLLASDGTFAEILRLELDAPLHMDGRSVIMQVARKLPRAIQDVLNRNALRAQDIQAFVLHQANWNLIDKVARTLDVPVARFPCNLNRYGNTSSASMLIAAAEFLEGAVINSPVIFGAFGAGVHWGAILASPAT